MNVEIMTGCQVVKISQQNFSAYLISDSDFSIV